MKMKNVEEKRVKDLKYIGRKIKHDHGRKITTRDKKRRKYFFKKRKNREWTNNIDR